MSSRFVLFDFDGTLIDSVPSLFRVFDDWVGALTIGSVNLQPELYSGMSIYQIVDRVHRQYGLGQSLAELESDYFSRIRHAYECVNSMDGAESLVRALLARGVTLGLVTTAPRDLVQPVLDRLDWNSIFSVCETGERGRPTKPSPQPYQAALAKLGFTANEGVAIEDSPTGVLSAHRSGITVFGFAGSGATDDLIAAGASKIIRRLGEAEALI